MHWIRSRIEEIAKNISYDKLYDIEPIIETPVSTKYSKNSFKNEFAAYFKNFKNIKFHKNKIIKKDLYIN